MADDIRTEDFNAGAADTKPGMARRAEAREAGTANANADLREKGDADDLAEAILQGDADTAIRDVGLRSDSPVDLTRVEIAENGPAAAAVEHDAAAVSPTGEDYRPTAEDTQADLGDFVAERGNGSESSSSRPLGAEATEGNNQEARGASQPATPDTGRATSVRAVATEKWRSAP